MDKVDRRLVLGINLCTLFKNEYKFLVLLINHVPWQRKDVFNPPLMAGSKLIQAIQYKLSLY